MSKKIKITLILIFILFIGLSTNAFASSYTFDFTYNDTDYTVITPDTDYTNFSVVYQTVSGYKYFYLFMYSDDVVLSYAYGINGASNGFYTVSVDYANTSTSQPSVVEQSTGFCCYASVSASSTTLDYSSSTFTLSTKTSFSGDVTIVYSSLDIYDYTDMSTVVFHSTPLLITPYLATKTLIPTAVTETIQTTLMNLIPVSLKIFATFLAISLILFVIYRLL